VALLTVLSALVVVLHRSPVYSALGLVGTLGMIAVLFLGLDAHVVGFLQVIVYAGAIVVLFLFVIMLLNLQAEPEAFSGAGQVALAMAGGVGFATVVVIGIWRAPVEAVTLGAGFGDMRPLAQKLFTAYLLPFELTSVLLLVAIVGAVVLGKKKPA
jgi:NADH-quinone oxidoreductase subunit J